jgi:hypothetical protein
VIRVLCRIQAEKSLLWYYCSDVQVPNSEQNTASVMYQSVHMIESLSSVTDGSTFQIMPSIECIADRSGRAV